MRKSLVTLTYTIIALLFTQAIAQTGKFYSTDKDLSNSLINAIYQDKRNYIWIATEDGLNKFDGVKFSVYKNKSGDSTTIKNNYVRVLFEDSKNRFWVGCINGLHIYDRAKDSFREIKLYRGGIKIEPHITAIAESKNGEIWISTSGEGVFSIKKGSDEIINDEVLSSKLNSNFLISLIVDSNQNLWIATENQGLNFYNPQTGEVLSYKAPNGIGSNQISSLCEDKQGQIYVGTLTGGLYHFNKGLKSFESIPYLQSLTPLPVKSMICDKQNRLLVGTDGKGMKTLNRKTGQLEDFQITTAPFDFSKMKVHAILQDKMGNVWTGLFQKGVFLSPNSPNKFSYYGHKSFVKNVIGSSCVMTILKDASNTLWVGTDNDGLYGIDASGKSTHYPHRNDKNSVSSTIMTMVDDENGSLWLGSFLDGLARFDKRTGQCAYFNNRNDTLLNNTSSNKIISIAKDHNKQLWIGSNGAGVYVFDIKTLQYVKHYANSGIGNRKINNDWINTIICDKEGVMWCGSYGGVFSIDPRTNIIKNYNIENKALPGNIVFALREDAKGNIWIGTTEGLVCFNKKAQTSKIFSMEDGLPSNVICSIQNDENGNIWLSTHMGISKFVVDENKFVNYYNFDGLQGNEFSMGAGFKDQKGQIFFGGINGVSSFYPSQLYDQRSALKLYLTGLNILDKPVVLGQKSGGRDVIDGFITDVETIHLGYKDNMFSLEFSTFDFGNPERVYYRYKMEGMNDEWMNTEQGINKISFTNLDYGSHELKIMACVHGNTSEERIITIIISPPWYLTWLAKIFYFLMFVLAIWIVTKYALNQIRHKQEIVRREHIEHVNEAKLQFFINISHEIRTPMTLIISPLEKLLAQNADAEVKKLYLLMHRNAQRILRLINQLMDIRKIDKGLLLVKYNEIDIVDFISDLMQTFEYQAKNRNIKFEFLHDNAALKVWVDPSNFDKVLMNLLSNAFKFTPDNAEITIVLRTGFDTDASNALKNYFEVIVSDSGIGIEGDKIEKIFERFYQIDNDYSKSNLGTGVGLHLSRSLVELQHGTIRAYNKTEGSGCEFVVRMPLGDSHFTKAEVGSSEFVHKQNTELELGQIPTYDDLVNQLPIAKQKSKTKYRILVVDDEEEIRAYIKSELSDMYRISESVNGKEALDFILKEKPDLVISDVMMPEMDGIMLCKKIKSNVNVKHIPVILLTAKSSDDDKAEGYDIGADAFVAKPFNVELLKRRVANLISNRERLEQKIADKQENKDLIKQVVLKSSDQILLEKVIKIINENLDNSDLNVELLASGVGMSRVHMHRKLKELTNMSARDYIKSIRLKQAAELLTGQKLTISEVAYALGFVSLSHFSNTFRDFYGMSPTDFIQNNSSREQ